MPLPAASCLTAGRNLSFGATLVAFLFVFTPNALAQAPGAGFYDDFESYPPGLPPSTWSYVSNGAILEGVSFQGKQALQLAGRPARADHTTNVSTSFDLSYVARFGTIAPNGVSTVFIQAGLQNRNLLWFESGVIYAFAGADLTSLQGPAIATYRPNEWVRVRVTREVVAVPPSTSLRARVRYWVNGILRATVYDDPGDRVLLPAASVVFTSSNITMWIDDVNVTPPGVPAVVITTSGLGAVQVGAPSTQTLAAELGNAPYSWAIAGGSLPPGMELTAGGVFSGTPLKTGSFTFTVSATDSNGNTDKKVFTVPVVFVLPRPLLRLQMISRSIAVPGRELQYTMVAENTGDAVATNVEIIQPLAEELRLISVSPSGSATVNILADNSLVHWIIPEVAPRESVILSYIGRVTNTAPINGTIRAVAYARTVSSLDTTSISSWVTCLYNGAELASSPVCQTCLFMCSAAVKACSAVLPAPLTILPCLQIAAPCVACVFTPDPTDPLQSSCFTKAGNTIEACWDAFKVSPLTQAIAEWIQRISGPLDPNEKLVASQKFIQPNQLLLYSVNFENKGDVEAKDIVITDVLDDNLDSSTLQLITPGATVDAATRTIKWSLVNKNLPPGGTDNVLVAIKPKPNLPSGTIIKNKATIQFEIFKPLTTNETVNIVDTTPPQCAVSALPALTTTTSFTVAWTGTDAVGEIETYSVFVSTNGGGFKPLVATKETSTTFSGQVGNTYAFLCVAKDTAENVESQAEVAETTTQLVEKVRPGDVNGDGKVDCADVAIVQALLGKTVKDSGFDARADVVKDDKIDVRDLAFVSKLLPAGTRCKP